MFSNDDQGRVDQNCKFHDPRDRGSCARVWPYKSCGENFFKNLLLYSGAYIRQTKYIVMVTNKGSTKIVTFMTPEAGVLDLGFGHISHIVKIH